MIIKKAIRFCKSFNKYCYRFAQLFYLLDKKT